MSKIYYFLIIFITAVFWPLNSEAAAEKVREYQFKDGAKIKVHFMEEDSKQKGEEGYFAQEALDAAVLAYQTITQFQGFSTPGYSFAIPNKEYAFDPDGTIDIYIGRPGDPAPLQGGARKLSFDDAPCFDTVKISEAAYQAVILLPANYREFIQNWERINPSSLGARNIHVDLKGTLIHEMLHTLLFYYHKNLNKEAAPGAPNHVVVAGQISRQKNIDWYVEGLARYFETMVGARHDFFSQGFKQTLPDKIRFSRGGSNYFMKYPDQAFTNLRYENALFWRFVDERFGMPAIERMSRDLRESDDENFKAAVEKMTGKPMPELLKLFALSILFKDFGFKEDAVYLKDVARTHLVYRQNALYLKDGFGKEKALGPVCRTDWIGEWGDEKAPWGDPAVAGDSTQASDVSGWATDFFEIDLDPSQPALPWLGVKHRQGALPLVVQIILVSKGGFTIVKDLSDIPVSQTKGLHLKRVAAQEQLTAGDVNKIFILITNTDRQALSEYEILVK